jgi:hypothetical protein
MVRTLTILYTPAYPKVFGIGVLVVYHFTHHSPWRIQPSGWHFGWTNGQPKVWHKCWHFVQHFDFISCYAEANQSNILAAVVVFNASS